ncbi:MAG: DNRLRE domain-containing protein [Promethearchaeota archaeon]
MNKKTKIGILLVFTTLTVLMLINFPLMFYTMNASSREINVNKDAYVIESQPNVNFGSQDKLYVGNIISGRAEAYYYFDISTLPTGWTEVKIELFFDFASSPVDVGANLTYTSWDENTITWNNKPSALIYRGHIVNDGFNFYIPLAPDNITNGEITICLYGKGGISDGYIQGTSKESSKIPYIKVIYGELDPIVISSSIISILSTFITIIMGTVLGLRTVEKKRRTRNNDFYRDYQRRIPQAWLEQPRIFPKSRKYAQQEKKINDYITLKLTNGRTYIYVNGRRFIQCIRLIFNIPSHNVHLYDEIESIDEAVKVYNTSEFQNRILQGPRGPNFANRGQGLTPEQEFWGHCSNLQAWVEHEYDTRVLMSNISFPLLRELTEAGDPLAKRVFKEEIAQRLESGYPSVVQYLLNQGYIKYFSPLEFKTIIETTDILKNLSSQPRMLQYFLLTCAQRYRNLFGDILLKILNLPEGKKILMASISLKKRSLGYRSPLVGYRSPLMVNPRLMHMIKTALVEVLNKVEEDMRKKVSECIRKIDEDIQIQHTRAAPTAEEMILQHMSTRLQEERELGIVDEAAIEARLQAIRRVLNQRREMQSRCLYCGRALRRGQKICDWCGHRKDDDDIFYPYPYIFKPPGGGGGSFKEGAIAIPVRV